MNKINNIGLSRMLTSAYDFDGFTDNEVWARIAQKINIIIEHFNYIDKKIENEKMNNKTKFDYLLGEGLTEQVAKTLIEKINDGTIGDLINNTLLKDINTKVDTFKNEINKQIDTKAKLTINYDGFGEPQNKTEQVYTYPNRINFGEINKAPIVKHIPNKGIDVIAHWYNDFGLEYTASAENSINGSYVWYDWSWNFTTNENYDGKRHPLLGWYKGDDINVLDWQCYWLAESGVNVVCLTQTGGFDSSDWDNPNNKHFWEYQLLNNVKNFRSLKYILSIKANSNSDTLEVLNSQNDKVVNAYKNYNNVYCYTENNKKYACVFAWDTELIRGSLDKYNGYNNTNAYYIALANKMKTIGYDGICILGRNTNANNMFDYLKENDVILLKSEYSGMYQDRNLYDNYENYSKNVPFPTEQADKTVLNVLTSAQSQTPHPSKWNITGSTPELFKNLVNKAINHIEKYKMPKILTVYNVSEWAEGGASLQPNMVDGFGYLDAIKQISFNNKNEINIDNIKKDTVKETFSQNTNWICGKISGITANGGSNGIKTVKEITSLYNVFDYTYKVDDYVFFATLQYNSDVIENVSCYIYPNFGTKRIYVVITNNSGDDITGIDINVMIRKINI